MRRLAAITILLAGVCAALLTAVGSSAQGSSSSRFDVIFDDARGLTGGQLVKIAGARAGTIDNVTVTSDFKARIEASVDSRFMPFHQDATCTIRPEGLIAENYIDCDPGTANRPPLRSQGNSPPTIPVQNTTEPVSLLDLFNMFNLPTRQRFMVLLNELGVATSGRGDDFNEVLRRANPALALARQTIGILSRQRAQLGALVDATDTIATEGATHTAALQNFLDRAAGLSTLTAQHRDNLSLGVQRLPGLLAAAQPSLSELDKVAVNGTPLVEQLHAAVPTLNRVSNDLGPFVRVAKPALARMTTALKKAIPAIRDVTPVVSTLRTYTHASLAGTKLMANLFSNLQRHGFVENFLSSFYYVTASTARFDATSHIAPDFTIDVNNGACNPYATTPVAGCSANYGSHPAYKPSAARTGRAAVPQAAPSSTAPRATPATPATRVPPGGPGAQAVAQQALNQILGGASNSTQSVQNLINYLLK